MAAVATRPPREIRLALVLNGGVSLAIWIGGVVAELDRVRRAGLESTDTDGDVVGTVYRQLLEATDSVLRTDVIAGASAGGLNGCLLASAIANHGSLADIGRTWVNLGSFADMLRSGLEKKPASLLKGDEYFLTELEREFEQRCDPALVRQRLGEACQRPGWINASERVELYVTGTDLRGEAVDYRDDYGAVLRDREHRAIFRFSHDPDAVRSDFERPEIARALARVARSTASFPGAFEPSYARVGGDDEGYVDLEPFASISSSRWIADGGILDNAPFRPALAAIARGQSRGPVRRVLCYVVPYGAKREPAAAARSDPPRLAGVVGAAFELPRELTFTETLAELEEFRGNVGRLQESRRAILAGIDDLAEHAETLFTRYRRGRRAVSARAAIEALLTPRHARLAREASRTAPRAVALVQDHAAALRLPWVPSGSFSETLADSNWTWGLAPIDRAARLGRTLLTDALAVAPYGPGQDEQRLHMAAARERLSSVIGWLAVTEEEAFEQAHRLFAERDEAADEEALQVLFEGPVPDGLSPPQRLQLVRLAYLCLAYRPVLRRAAEQHRRVAFALASGGAAALSLLDATPASVGPTRRQETQHTLHNLLLEGGTPLPVGAVARRLLALEVVQQTVAGHEEDKEQRLAWTRINAETPCVLDGRSRPNEKLLGLGLQHFAAFLKSSWRANDWMWGRLDGASRVIDLLLDPPHLRLLVEDDERRELLVQHLISAAQGPGGPDTVYLRQRSQQKHGRTVGAAISSEIAALREWNLETTPQPMLPMTNDLLTARVQLAVARTELPVVREAAIADATGKGAAPDSHGADWADTYKSLDYASSATTVQRALSELRLAERESLGSETGSSMLTRNTATAAVVASSVLSASESGIPGPVRFLVKAVRGLLLLLYGLTWSLTSRRDYVRALGLLLLVAALVVFGWSVLSDIDARDPAPGDADGPPGFASGLAKAVIVAGVLLGLLRGGKLGVVVAIILVLLYLTLILTPWPDDWSGGLERLWSTHPTLTLVILLILFGLLAGVIGERRARRT